MRIVKKYIRRRSGHLASAIEQSLYSGSNFAASLVVAALLGASEFGVFAALYAAVMLGSVLHNSYIAEPILVFGGRLGVGDSGFRHAVTRSMRNWFLVGLIIFIISYFFSEVMLYPTGSYHLGVTLMLAWLGYGAYWTAKFLLYLYACSSALIIMCAIYSVSMIVLLLSYNYLFDLTAFSAVGISGCAALISSFFGYRCLRNLGWRFGNKISADVELNRRWFLYGHWTGVAGTASWIVNNAFLIILPLLGMPDKGGVLRLGLTMLMPIQQLINSIVSFSLPSISRKVSSNKLSHASLYRWSIFLVILSGLFSLIVYGLANYFGSYFEGTTYADLIFVLPILALLPMVWSLISCFRVILKAYEKTKKLAAAYGISVLCILIVPFLYSRFDVLKVSSYGLVAANIFVAVYLIIVVLRLGSVSKYTKSTH